MSFANNHKMAASAKYLNMFKTLAVVLGVLLLCVPAFSQGNAGRILGTVTDQTGGVVAGATVSVVDVARGVTRTLTTDDAGEYNAPNLTPGQYTVRAEAKGFKKLERQNVVIEVGKEVRVDLTVQPGEQEQTVTVTEAVPLVETTNATLGGTLDNADISDMPLNGRDYQNLLALRPGVMNQVGGGPWTQSTNGVRPDESVWMIDGVINHNFFDARPIAGMPSPITDGATILPIDSIQEFNLMENPKAEYGWDPGAVVNVGIRSGTNSLHGTIYGFYRSSAWDARNYFNVVAANGVCLGGAPLAVCNQTPTQLKQYGASVGGPIIKDKLFFFGNFEGLNDLIGNAFGTGGVPQTGPSGAGTTFTDFGTALAAVVNNGQTPSPVSMAAAGCTVTGTAPNATASCTGGVYFPSSPNGNSFLSTIPNVNNSYNGVGKIDYHANDKNTLNGELLVGNYVGNGEDRGFVLPVFSNGFIIKTWTTAGVWDYTPNSAMVNEVRFGYNRMTFLTTSGDAGLSLAGLNTGLTSGVLGLPTLQIGKDNSGDLFALAGTWHNRPQAIAPNPYWDVQDSLSYLIGKHSLKFGGEYTHIEADSDIPDYGRGRINFPNLESFFEGVTNSGSGKAGKALVGDPTRRMLNYYMAGFVQDDWRLTPKLTLNLGLRYEYASPIKDSANLWANFDPNTVTGLVQQGSPGENTMWAPNRGNFSPRLGFAYDVSGKGTTVVRGGFSVMYSSFTAVEWMNQNQFQNSSSVSLAANPTAGQFVTCTGACLTPVTGTAPSVVAGPGSIAVSAAAFSASQLCWDSSIAIAGSACGSGQTTVFPKSAAVLCGDHVTPGNPAFSRDPGQCAIMGVDPNLKTPYVMNYSLGVTHAFGDNLSLEVGYVGNRGSRLTGFADINQQAPSVDGSGARPFAAKFPWFSFINMMTNDTHSNYNSAQATLTKRMSHGLSFTAGYTYAHGLDNGSLNRFGLLPQNTNNPGAEYGNSDFDVRHRFTITATYNIPGVNGFGQVLKGWQINAIATIQSAQPWTVDDYNNNFSGSGDSADRWDFFGTPADFKGTQVSIPYCTGFTIVGGTAQANGYITGGTASGANATCTQTSAVYGTASAPSNSSAIIANCVKNAPDPNTLAGNPNVGGGIPAGGCFGSGNSVMTPPVAGTFGTMGRNIFRDSGYKNLDLSVFKSFTFKERYTAQFRAEIFNILNHPVIENPYGASNGSSGGNNDPSTPTAFGGSSGTPDVVAGNPVVGSGDSRAIQIGLKLSF
jgi:hypothetical protein